MAPADRHQTLRLLRLEHSVSQLLTSVESGRDAFSELAPVVGAQLGWAFAAFWLPSRSGGLRAGLAWHAPGKPREEFEAATRALRLEVGHGLPGRVWESGVPAWIGDLETDTDFPRREAARSAGLRSAAAFPLVGPDGPIGVIEAFRTTVERPDQDLLDTLAGIGRQVAQARARAAAHRTLRKREAVLSGILDAALDAIITIDAEGVVESFNPAAERIFGIPAAEAIGQEMAVLVVPDHLREAHRAGLARCVGGEGGSLLDRRVEVSAMRGDGTVFPAELTITRLKTVGRPAFAGHVRDITERQAMVGELRASRARIAAAADAERRRVERDLHDGAQQLLLVVGLELRAAAEALAGGDGAAAGGPLARAARELEQATSELRELARGLHPSILSDRGLPTALAGLVRRAPLPVALEVELEDRLPPAVEAAAYFVVAEALTNVARYAEASQAAVTVGLRDDALLVEVADDGRGGARLDGGTGLRGLADRLAVLEGSLVVESPTGGGTRVSARIPLGA